MKFLNFESLILWILLSYVLTICVMLSTDDDPVLSNHFLIIIVKYIQLATWLFKAVIVWIVFGFTFHKFPMTPCFLLWHITNLAYLHPYSMLNGSKLYSSRIWRKKRRRTLCAKLPNIIFIASKIPLCWVYIRIFRLHCVCL